MSVGQTIPNVTTTLKWKTKNGQTQYDEMSWEVVQVRITAAQLKALRATAIQIIIAPPANQASGRSYFVHQVFLKINFGTTAYTLNAGTLKLFVGAVANALPITADLATILTSTASKITGNIPTIAYGPDTLANTTNQAILLGNGGAAEFTLGDGTLDVTVLYGITTP